LNDYSSESASYSKADESKHSMLARRIRDITQYSFKDEELLTHVFTHHSLPGNSRFRQLEFMGDKVINAVIALQNFDINKRVEDLNN
jgi:dsRNA-specific ribonuclease